MIQQIGLGMICKQDIQLKFQSQHCILHMQPLSKPLGNMKAQIMGPVVTLFEVCGSFHDRVMLV